MHTIKKLFWPTALVLATLMAPAAWADAPIDTLEKLQKRIAYIHQEHGSTAVGVALIEQGELVWLDAMGLANVEHNVAATPDSLFRIGSTSKMFIALAALKLQEEGRLDLQTPIRELVPEVVFDNPWEAEHPVRLVHLLEHTSGWPDMRIVEFAHNDPNPIILSEALMLYPESRQSRWVPGTRMAYSSIGSGVAAYAVEKVVGMPFEDYVKQTFLTPLGMLNADYFKPDDFINRAAAAYRKGREEDYWHIAYRPAGSLNVSPREMANLLQFFLQRGQVGDTRLLSPESIDRMETPHTTLGNALGITAGYGLANCTDNYRNSGIIFHGHGGSVMGAVSEFVYAPAINGGFAITMTGNAGGLRKMTNAIREYQVRDLDKPDITPGTLPTSLQGLDGVYKMINPRLELIRVLPNYLTAMTFSRDGEFVLRMPMAGGRENPFKYYSLGDNLLIDPRNQLPTVAVVQDPLAGVSVQVGMDLYQKTSRLLVWAELLFFISVLAVSALAVLYALFWLPLNLYRKTLASPEVRLRLWPTLSGIFLLASLAVFLTPAGLFAYGPWGSAAIAVFVLTLGYGVTALWSLINCVLLRYRLPNDNPIKRRFVVPAYVATLLHVSMAVYLASYGLIGAQTWTW